VWREIPTTLERQRGEYLRGPTCIAAEKLLRDVVQAGEAMRNRDCIDYSDQPIDAWDRALAALKGTP